MRCQELPETQAEVLTERVKVGKTGAQVRVLKSPGKGRMLMEVGTGLGLSYVQGAAALCREGELRFVEGRLLLSQMLGASQQLCVYK